ncbi:LysR family transcriptional regulator [Luteimonas sp. BDR2-5]|uniref:LysR family transcriptional regulator n=1 Tax=Proluteimonas luteida TaxID=2878685 RepID=UPI001E3B2ACB|nr:LysR family transcriptional regulator [Luteimonas sp. BDR2-5]MCD9029485.1 LysR family transcriptional regulator [Luteimonas sp. BDR2-5]
MKTTLDELQAFVAVVDAGSITAAARRLGQTVSGVSRALGRLEDKLQTTLLRRTTRRLALTEEGRLFLDDARTVLAGVEAAEDRMATLRTAPSGLLRVDAATPFLLHVLVPRIAGFRAAYPQITLELSSHDRVIDLLEQRTDVAIRIGALKDSTLHAHPLADSRIRVLAAPAYLARHGVPTDVDALDRHVLLGFAGLPHLNRWPLRNAGDGQVEVAPAITASSGETVRQLALAGNGIACLSDFMTAADRRAGTLVELFADRALDIRQPIHAVYYRNSGVASRIRVFLDHLAQSLRDDGGEASWAQTAQTKTPALAGRRFR